MIPSEETAKRIFGERAKRYTTSASHTDPKVLAQLVELSAPDKAWRDNSKGM